MRSQNNTSSARTAFYVWLPIMIIMGIILAFWSIRKIQVELKYRNLVSIQAKCIDSEKDARYAYYHPEPQKKESTSSNTSNPSTSSGGATQEQLDELGKIIRSRNWESVGAGNGTGNISPSQMGAFRSKCTPLPLKKSFPLPNLKQTQFYLEY